MVPYCYLFLLSVFVLWFSFCVNGMLCKFWVDWWPPVWKGAVRSVCRECLSWGLPSVYVFGCLPFGFLGGMWDLIVSIPDHYLSFYFVAEIAR